MGDPVVENVEVRRRGVEPNPEGVWEELVVHFTSRMGTQDAGEANEICLVLDLDSKGKVIYQRELHENYILITPNTNPVFGVLCKWIRRCNSFWVRTSLIF